MTKPRTVGELRQAGYAPRSVKTEIRQNLLDERQELRRQARLELRQRHGLELGNGLPFG